jgi:hypothetical protein
MALASNHAGQCGTERGAVWGTPVWSWGSISFLLVDGMDVVLAKKEWLRDRKLSARIHVASYRSCKHSSDRRHNQHGSEIEASP